MLDIGRPVPQKLGPEIADVQPKDAPPPHRAIPPSRRPDPTPETGIDATEGRQSATQIGIFAVELDGAVKAADPSQRVTSNREVAAVENRPNPQRMVNDHMCWWCDDEVIEANKEASSPVPIVEPIRAGNGDRRAALLKPSLDALQPEDWRAAISVQIGKNVARCVLARRLARDDQPFLRLLDDSDAGNRASGGASFIRAGVVDDKDFIRQARLREEGKKTSGQILRLVVCADDCADRHEPGIRDPL